MIEKHRDRIGIASVVAVAFEVAVAVWSFQCIRHFYNQNVFDSLFFYV